MAGTPEWLDALIERARGADGQPPFSDQSLVDLRRGERELLALGEYAASIVSETEAELVVDPDARGRGHGTALIEAVLAEHALRPVRQDQGGKTQGGKAQGPLLVWAHGDNPAARALAAKFGFEPVRRLLQLRYRLSSSSRPSRDVSATEISTGSITGIVRSFRIGIDEEAWVALNAKAFAFHPEQGSVSVADIEDLEREPWFEADDFLLLWDGDDLIGYCWLKVEVPSTGSGTGIGEIYVIGVSPDRQGEGLGRTLMNAGLERLEHRGIRTAALYVEADNASALRLYESIGFSQHTVDIQYRLTRFTPRS